MSVYIDKSKGRWRFTFNRVIAGKRTRATKLLPAGWGRAQAEKYDREETARLYAVAAGLERPEPSIGAAVALYLDHRIPKLRNGKKAARDLAHLVPYIEGQPISKLPDVALDYAKDHQALAAGTIRNRLAYLKAACRYAWKKHKLTEHDPAARMELPAVNNARVVHLPVPQLEAQLRRIEDLEARALFTIAFFTGSRWISEILPRLPVDVYRNGKRVELRVGTTKNGTPRLVPVHPAARWALAYLPFNWKWRWYYERFVKARIAGALLGLRPHDMRRTGNQRDAMEALHHASVQSSLRYTQFATQRLEDVLFSVGSSKKMHTAKPRRRTKNAA